MDIDKLIKRQAPSDNKHDRAYARALRTAYDLNRASSRQELLEYQKLARAVYAKDGNTHQNTARCVVIYELLRQDN